MAEKFTRIISLGPERVGVINNQLATGASAQTVARLIQQEWGEFQDVAEKTLMQQLLRYKKDTIVSEQVVEEMHLPATSEKVKQLKHSMNALGEMIELAELQKTRVQGFIEREKSLQMPIKGTSQDIEMLMTMYKDIQKVQFDLGVDEYRGPILQAGRSTTVKTTSADGTVTEVQTVEAVETTLAVLKKHKAGGNVIEGESIVVPAGNQSD